MFFAYLASALAIMLALIFAFKVEERFSVTGLATLALAIATIFLAWDAHQQLPILSGQLDEMKEAYDLTIKAVGVAEKTANAAIEANNLTRQTFILGQRPWVFYDYLAMKITSPLFLDTQIQAQDTPGAGCTLITLLMGLFVILLGLGLIVGLAHRCWSILLRPSGARLTFDGNPLGTQQPQVPVNTHG